MYELSIYMGIVGFVMIVFSFLTGLRVFKFKAKYRIHKKIGIVGFAVVSVHAFIMLYYFFFS